MGDFEQYSRPPSERLPKTRSEAEGLSNAPISASNSTKPMQAQEQGAAFGGRLRFPFVRKESGGIAGVLNNRTVGVEPSGEVLDYQFLRLKFLLNKALGQGVNLLEIFEHFDTDFSGEIDMAEFHDGLKRLGIYLTRAESLALMNRFNDSGQGEGIR